MKTQTVIERIASLVVQNQNCVKANNTEWDQKSRAELDNIAKNLLPSGSGIDCGTKINLGDSTEDKIVLVMQYHHMDENGMYSGWTQHNVIVRPSFVHTLDVTITGKDRNEIKEYLHEVYFSALTEPYEMPVNA